MNVAVIIEEPRWAHAGLEGWARECVAASFAHLALPTECELSVLGCDDRRIAQLNGDFRSKPMPTNVLSWPSEERSSDVVGAAPLMPPDAEELGDIAIAYETTLREAKEGGLSLEDHTKHLIVHGLLHLLGYDHENDADGDLMESVETAILATLGIADPYSSGAPDAGD